MLAAPKRRWSRFSLRAMFVVVTVLAVWLGWQVRWLHQRDEFQAWLKGQEEFAAAHRHEFSTSTAERLPEMWAPKDRWLLWMFGREQVKVLTLTFILDELEELPARREEALIKAAELFPEAAIVICVHHNAPATASPSP